MDPRDTSFENPAHQPQPPQPPVVTHDRRSSQGMGVLLIVLGLIFLVDRVGWQWDVPWAMHLTFGKLWPLLLIVAGIGTAFSDREAMITTVSAAAGQPRAQVEGAGRRNYGDGIFLVFVGVLMLLHVNHLLSLRQSWPLFIVAVGLSIIFGKNRRDRRLRRLQREGR